MTSQDKPETTEATPQKSDNPQQRKISAEVIWIVALLLFAVPYGLALWSFTMQEKAELSKTRELLAQAQEIKKDLEQEQASQIKTLPPDSLDGNEMDRISLYKGGLLTFRYPQAGQRRFLAVAAQDGQVSDISKKDGYWAIELLHPLGWRTRYERLTSVKVQKGQKVEMGRYLGRITAERGLAFTYLDPDGKQNLDPLNHMIVPRWMVANQR